MAPWWVTLAVGLLGVVGVWYTAHRADAREKATFEREMAREEKRWKREDDERTFQAKSEALISFYRAVAAVGDALRPVTGEYQNPAPVLEQLIALHGQLVGIQIYGTATVFDRAYSAFEAAETWENALGTADADTLEKLQDRFGEVRYNLLAAIRTELGVPSLLESWE